MSHAAYSQRFGLWVLEYHFGNNQKKTNKKLMTLTREDKCHANMHSEDTGPRVLGLHYTHNSATSLMKKEHCYLESNCSLHRAFRLSASVCAHLEPTLDTSWVC